MNFPERDVVLRIGYTLLGGGSALLWNRYLPLHASGGGYIPPTALAALIVLSENSGETERDVAAAILGFTSAAQAISFANQNLALRRNPVDTAEASAESLDETVIHSQLELEAKKLKKIRAVTGTLGALTQLVSTFKRGL
jgi:hypothetical protein